MVIPEFRIQSPPDMFNANVGQGAQIAIQGFNALQRANENEDDRLYKITQANTEGQKLLAQPGFKLDESGKIVFDKELFQMQKAAAVKTDIQKATAIAAAQSAEKVKGQNAAELFKMSQPQTKVENSGGQLFQITTRPSPRGPLTETTPLTERPPPKETSSKGLFKETKGGGILNTATGEFVVEPHGLDESKLPDIDKEELKGLREAIKASQFDPNGQAKAMNRYNSKISEIRGRGSKKTDGAVPEFKTESEAIASGKKGRVKIGGRLANID